MVTLSTVSTVKLHLLVVPNKQKLALTTDTCTCTCNSRHDYQEMFSPGKCLGNRANQARMQGQVVYMAQRHNTPPCPSYKHRDTLLSATQLTASALSTGGDLVK